MLQYIQTIWKYFPFTSTLAHKPFDFQLDFFFKIQVRPRWSIILQTNAIFWTLKTSSETLTKIIRIVWRSDQPMRQIQTNFVYACVDHDAPSKLPRFHCTLTCICICLKLLLSYCLNTSILYNSLHIEPIQKIVKR